MEKVSWETVFNGELNVVLDDNKKTKLFYVRERALYVFAMEAIRILRNELPTGAEVMKSWRIKRFSAKEGILEIEKVKV